MKVFKMIVYKFLALALPILACLETTSMRDDTGGYGVWITVNDAEKLFFPEINEEQIEIVSKGAANCHNLLAYGEKVFINQMFPIRASVGYVQYFELADVLFSKGLLSREVYEELSNNSLAPKLETLKNSL